MKRTQILATLAFAFILGASVPLFIEQLSSANDASAAEQAEEAEQDQTETSTAPSSDTQGDSTAINAVDVSTAEEFIAAVEDSTVDKITLTANLENLDIDINRPMISPLVIDLAGHTIVDMDNNSRILISQGKVRITGEGFIENYGKNVISVRGSATNTGKTHVDLTIDKDIKLYNASLYGLVVIPYDTNTQQYGSYGVKINMNGHIVGAYGMHVNELITDSDNCPEINIGDDAQILTSNISGETPSNTPIYAAGVAIWNIGNATLRGSAGIGIHSGEFTFNGTIVDIIGTMNDNPVESTNGVNLTGVVFQIEHDTAYADNVVLNINGGTYTSAQGDVFYEYGTITESRAATHAADINITGGTFTAGNGRAIFGGPLSNPENADIEISGGEFHGTDATPEGFASFLADGYILDASGTVIPDPASPEDVTLTSGNVTVVGKFNKTNLRLEVESRGSANKNLFGNRLHVAYYLRIYDGDTLLTDLPAGMRITTVVPEYIDGSKAQVYWITEDADGSSAAKISFTYQNNAVTFTANTLGTYAIVEESATSTRPSGSTTSPEASEGPSDSKEPTNPTPDQKPSTDGNKAPDTGLNQGRGAITAASTITSLICGAIGVIIMVCLQKILSRRKAVDEAAIEMEIDQQLAELNSPEEPIVERFVAEAIESEKPKVTPVDTFILQK